MKQLKIWNGRGHGKQLNSSVYVAAYSAKQAAELVGTACGLYQIDAREIRDYYSKDCWATQWKA